MGLFQAADDGTATPWPTPAYGTIPSTRRVELSDHAIATPSEAHLGIEK
jgi:hypothetical protein